MRLTRLFVRRPSLVVVACALVAIAGFLALRGLVQQQFPNVDFPVIQVRLSYAGASPSELRDSIVKPVEDAIAGAPNLDHIATTITPGQASIAATFVLGSDPTSDLVEIQRRVQSTRSVLPTDLAAPSIGSFDPAEATVATLSVTSKSMSQAALSALITDTIVPEMEQTEGISNVDARGTVTPAIEVTVDPRKLQSYGYTLGDVVTSISQNNVRAPGGIAYGRDRETSVDVRGDVANVGDVASLPLLASSAGSTGGATITGPEGGTGLTSTANGATGGSAATSFGATGGAAASTASTAATTATASTAATATTGTSAQLPGSASATGATPDASATDAASGATAQQSTTGAAASGTTGTTGAAASAGGTTAGGATTGGAPANASTGGGAGSGSNSATIGITSTTQALQGSSSSTGVATTGTTVAQSTIPLTGTASRSGANGASTPAPSASAAAGTSSGAATSAGASSASTASTGTASSGTASTTSSTAASGSTTSTSTSSSATASGPARAFALGNVNAWSVSPRVLRLDDVAGVADGFEIKRVFGYVGAGRAVTLNAQKTTGASEITASKSILALVPALQAEYPAVQFNVLNVQATYTQQQLDSVYKSIALGILFTGIVMLFFLKSWRNAVVVLIAIPTSLLVTLFVMSLAHFTIDTISLLAMTLIVGILVDDSIVVLENTERHYEDGEAPRTAAILGRAEIGAAAVVITLVDVVVFLPVAFLPGTVGKFLEEFGLVVVVATLTSLAVSFTITPALAGNWSLLSRWKPWRPITAFSAGFDRVRRWYVERALEWALAHGRTVAAVSALLTVGAVSLVPLGYVGFEFIPAVDRGEVFLQLTFPTGTPLVTTNNAVADLARRLDGQPDILKITSQAGSYSSGFGGGITNGADGQLHVFLVDHPKLDTFGWVAKLNKLARGLYPRAKPAAIPATGSGGGNAQPIDDVITSLDDDPAKYAAAVLKVLAATPGVSNANSSASIVDPQVDIVFDRARAQALGIDVATAVNAVRAAFGGSQAAQFETSRGVEYVQVTYPVSSQTSVQSIPHIPIRTRTGSIAYVGDVAHLEEAPVTPLITRVNRQTVVHVSANVQPGATLSIVQKAFAQRLAGVKLPDGVTVKPNAGGNGQNLKDTTSGLTSALGLSFILVFLLMVALYDSYRLPIIIMFAIPVAAVGAIGSLALTGQTLNLFSLIGTVLLVGLVSKNGILLVDFANHRIRAGVDRRAAIRESARERFRPIIMTTFSMIAGMTPIALALDPGSSTRRSLGIVVIGGLTSSLLLTLVLVPVAFVWLAPRHPQPAREAEVPVPELVASGVA